ncbi:MAG: flagellar assembly protein FliH [Archangiaceae bacterium]|nr:flagellar assembly protein FliH [Archangiaceae bacterium]
MADENDEHKPRTFGAKVIRGGASAPAPSLDRAGALGPPPVRRGVVSSEDFEAKQSANKIIEEAHAKAAEIVAQAEADRDGIFEKAAEEARAEVQAESTEELARAKLQAGQIVKNMELEIVELALKIAAKIIGRDLQRDPGVVAEICATAIETARASKAMVLRVNPRDGVILREQHKRLIELVGRTVEISIRDDADVEPGGCVVRTEFGTIDAQLKTQLGMLQNVLLPDSAKKEGPK